LNRILVVRVGALGDTLMVTPVVRALRRQNPKAEIDFLCSGLAGSLLEENPNITRIIRLHGRNLAYAISLEKRRLVQELRSRDYDLAILLESAPRYRELLTRAEILTIRGFEEVPFDRSRHCIENYMHVAGVKESGPGNLDMELHITPDEEAAVQRLLTNLPEPRIGIQMGYGPRKKKKDQSLRLKGWDRESWAQLIPKLLDLGASILMTGSAEDRDDVQCIVQGLPRDRVRSLAGCTNVRELAAIIRNLDLFISVDTGPAHMAAALGTPLVVLWGPAIYEQIRPISSFSPIEIVRVLIPCAPCYDTPAMKSCEDNLCMKGITSDAVLSAAISVTGAITSKFQFPD
jgi:ADP-heptose:LPS heptosyltransferase